jgi:UDP-N-acetylglucosamine 4-epimerase
LNDERVSLVRVLDNLATGSLKNIEAFMRQPKFEFVEGDIRNYDTCLAACDTIDLITHQAALGSVPRSIVDPLTTNNVNITGTLNIFTAAKEKNIKRVVYAASSSTYGDHPGLPKVEDKIGNPLSSVCCYQVCNGIICPCIFQFIQHAVHWLAILQTYSGPNKIRRDRTPPSFLFL